MAQLTPQQKEELEILIDSTTLEAVLYALAEICDEKALHVQATWQDTATAKAWRGSSQRIGRTADSIPNL